MPSDHPTSRLGYTNDNGQEVWMIDGANVYATPSGVRKRLFVVHHTDGVDSREYGRNNARRVSYHYLVGSYADAGGLRLYKYASEIQMCTHTQGYGSIGRYLGYNINDYAVSMEIEGPPFTVELINYAARAAGSILRGWRQRGTPLIMVPHLILDKNKEDPAFDWHNWCQLVYKHSA